MSYVTEIQSNNTNLQAILESIDALPEAGASAMCTVTFVNNSDDSITLYPKYEGYSDSINVDRYESTSIEVPKNSAVWFTGWVPLGGSANPTTAGSVTIGSSTYDGMVAVYSDGTITIRND